MGIEPTSRRVNDDSTALKAAGPESQVVDSQRLSDTWKGRCTTGCTEVSESLHGDGDLAEVMAAWPRLPEAVRADILAMVAAGIGRG